MKKLLVAAISGAVLVATAGTASADTAYNTLDNTIDSTLESMSLTWDEVNLVGSTGSTTLRMRVDGPPDDRGGCNVQGDPQFVTVTATSTDTSVVVLTNGPDYTFNNCSESFTVSVQATGVGSADINFAVDLSKSSAPSSGATWSTVEGDFTVNVSPGSGTSVGCDAHPAAPAWAAAILQKSGYKPGAKQTKNLISAIAGEMTQHADFAGLQKSGGGYADAVQARLVELTGNSGLAPAAAAARPGWTCGPTS